MEENRLTAEYVGEVISKTQTKDEKEIECTDKIVNQQPCRRKVSKCTKKTVQRNDSHTKQRRNRLEYNSRRNNFSD